MAGHSSCFTVSGRPCTKLQLLQEHIQLIHMLEVKRCFEWTFKVSIVKDYRLQNYRLLTVAVGEVNTIYITIPSTDDGVLHHLQYRADGVYPL